MGDAFPVNIVPGGYGSTGFYWRLANMSVLQSLHSRMTRRRSLRVANCVVNISETGSSVFVNVYLTGTGDVYVSLPLRSMVKEQKGLTSMWYYLANPVVSPVEKACSGVETANV